MLFRIGGTTQYNNLVIEDECQAFLLPLIIEERFKTSNVSSDTKGNKKERHTRRWAKLCPHT